MNWSEIAKYLSGETDRNENEKMGKWIRKDPKNKQLVDNLSIFLKKNKMENRSQNINVEKAWEQLKNRIEESGETADYEKVISLRRTLLKYAAIILVFIGIGSLGYFSYYKINQTLNYVSIETEQFEKKNNQYSQVHQAVF